MKKILSSLITILLFGLAAVAQNKNSEKADELFRQDAFLDALEAYRDAYTKESSAAQKGRIIYQIAESYRKINDVKNAKSWYERSIRAKHDNPKQYYYLGKMLMQEENYDGAIDQFETYKKLNPKDALADMGIKSCKMALQWKANPTRWQVKNEVQINSAEHDFAPAFEDKKNINVIFTSSRKGSSGDEVDSRIGENFQDIWIAVRDRKKNWSEPVLFNPEINTEDAHEGTARLSYKRNEIYFTRCEVGKKEKKGCDIYKSGYVAGRLSGIEKMDLKAGFGDSVTVGHPAPNKKGDAFIFSSDMPGGRGGRDLWIITYDKKAKTWSKPKNLGPKINTAGDELFPFLSPSDELYFSSDGLVGMGGLDIFKAPLSGEFRWGPATNMQSPINSAGDDYGITFNKSKKEGFFTSNRKGGRGKDDIYSFYYPPLLFVLQGTVMDKDKGTPLDSVKVAIVGSDGKSKEVYTDAAGKYKFEGRTGARDINENTTYSITVTRQNYLIAKDKISTVGAEESMTFVQDFLIQYSAPNKPIALPEVQYEVGSWKLKETSKDSLNFLYDILIENANIVVELQAHTDSRGDDDKNMELSQKRAQSCVDYLISKGIDKERLKAKGFGETKLRIPDSKIDAMASDDEKEAAHQKNRRTEFSVIATNYIPKGAIEGGN